jgi:predicted regulator of amino acid metabolism with ACT domain
MQMPTLKKIQSQKLTEPLGWHSLRRSFISKSPRFLSVAECLLENGISIKHGVPHINNISIPIASIAEHLKVDRRMVQKALIEIEKDPELRVLFATLRAHPSFEIVGTRFNQGVIEIMSKYPGSPGFLSRVASIISQRGVNIRNLHAQDGTLTKDARIVLVLDQLPRGIIDELSKVEGVEKISYYTSLYSET